jgi:hypothetical protein
VNGTRWKDYRRPDKTLSVDEFPRRFLLNVWPDGFRRIRHFGFLANTHRTARLASIRALTMCRRPTSRRRRRMATAHDMLCSPVDPSTFALAALA